MRISFVPADIRLVESDKTGLYTLRTFDHSALSVDGTVIEPNAKGVSSRVLSKAESDAFHAIAFEVNEAGETVLTPAFAAMVADGEIVLPSVGGRGKPTATGVSLLSLIGTSSDPDADPDADPEADAAEAPETPAEAPEAPEPTKSPRARK